jgi:hypothetical protein
MDAQADIDMRTLDALLRLESMRSADRASLVQMQRRLRKGTQLSYQERQNLWAYANRYSVPTLDATRK